MQIHWYIHHTYIRYGNLDHDLHHTIMLKCLSYICNQSMQTFHLHVTLSLPCNYVITVQVCHLLKNTYRCTCIPFHVHAIFNPTHAYHQYNIIYRYTHDFLSSPMLTMQTFQYMSFNPCLLYMLFLQFLKHAFSVLSSKCSPITLLAMHVQFSYQFMIKAMSSNMHLNSMFSL